MDGQQGDHLTGRHPCAAKHPDHPGEAGSRVGGFVHQHGQAPAGRAAQERRLFPGGDALFRPQSHGLEVLVPEHRQGGADERREVGTRGAQAHDQERAPPVGECGREAGRQLQDVVMGQILGAEGRRDLGTAVEQPPSQTLLQEGS